MDEEFYLDGEEKFGYLASRFYSFFSGLATWKLYKQIIESVQRLGPKSVLDVGCGPANVIIRLATRLKDTKFRGIDPSIQMVKVATRNVRRHGLSDRVIIQQGSSRSVLNGDKYDLIMSSFSFHHWRQQLESIINLTQSLNDHGTLSIYDLNADGFYGRLPVVKRHSLSSEIAKQIESKGFPVKVEYTERSRLIILNVRRPN